MGTLNISGYIKHININIKKKIIQNTLLCCLSDRIAQMIPYLLGSVGYTSHTTFRSVFHNGSV